MIITSVINVANKSQCIPIALLLKKLRIASQSYTKQSALKLLKIRTVTDPIIA